MKTFVTTSKNLQIALGLFLVLLLQNNTVAQDSLNAITMDPVSMKLAKYGYIEKMATKELQ